MKFSDLNLTESLLSGLTDVQFTEPTPIQEKAIPPILEGKDMIGIAQTGTGKTGAFVIPIMNRILQSNRNGMKAIILSPTRELAQQIDEQIFALGYHTGITSATVIGGSNFSVQAKALKAGVDIIVATPGRFIDQKKIVDIDFSTVEFLVLDEADRMLDMGFLPDMKKIISWLPEKRQTLLFSATMPAEIEKLASGIMNSPVTVEIARAKAPTQVEQRAYAVLSNQKIPLIKKIFETIKWDSCIIFTSTKKGTDELQRLLRKEGIKAVRIHGDRSQEERNKALNAFKAGTHPVIVATNVIARGIDIKDVSMIVNYDVPRSPDDYIHRIGRTGRYDKSGIAVTFVTRRDNSLFRDIENEAGGAIKKIGIPEDFNENSTFYWDKQEAVGSTGKKKKEDSGSSKGKGGDDREEKGATKEKSDTGRPPRPGSKRSSGKKSSRQEKGEEKKQEKERTSEKGRKKPQEESKQKGRTNGSDRGSDSATPRSAGKMKRPPILETAVERNKNSRPPAKGFWGIVKSLIPRFKKEN
ncbi:MAG: DEAD/DEAH box helicase [Balneolaceae bacterium]